MKTHKSYHFPKFFLILYFIILVIFSLVAAVIIISQLIGFDLFKTEEPQWIMSIFGLFFIFMIGWCWHFYLRLPWEIRVLDDNRIDFRCFLKTNTVFPDNIKSIKGSFLWPGFVILKHSKGSVLILSQMDNFHEFISFLKNSNPNIEIRGC